MAVVTAGVGEDRAVDAPVVVAERLAAFGVEVLAGAMNRPVQVRNGGLYLRGLLEQGSRKSLERLVERLGGTLTISRCSSSWPTVRGCTRSGRVGRSRWDGRCISRRSGAMTRSGA